MSQLKTLRVRFALWTAGWLLLVLILLGTFIYLNLASALAQSIDDALRLAAAQILLYIDDETLLIEDAEAVISSAPPERLSVRIIDLEGEVRQGYGPHQNLPQPARPAALNQPGQFVTIDDPATGHPVRVYSIMIVEDEELVGMLQVAQSLLGVQQTLNQLLTTLLIAGPLVVLAAGVGGYLLAARALRPVDQIARTARRISVEDLSARLNLPATDDEIGRLATTFDTMLARLDDGVRRERQFIADASHEFRTPLTTMETILSATLARPRPPTEYEQALVDLSDETGRMKLLAEGLLMLARNDRAQAAPHDTVNLSLLLQDVTDSLRPLAEDKGLALDCQMRPNLLLTADSDGLIRLFANLLGNAIKYTDNGSITVSLHQETGEFIEIAVTDTGPGIPARHLPHIFDRFYRTDESRATSGTGLGLAIALAVAQAHGGGITVRSQVGQGSQFLVKLAKS